MREISRDEVRALLERWSKNEATAPQVHEEAEALLEAADWPEHPKGDPRSIPIEVLSQLEILNHQLITPEDIPAMRSFLATPVGGEAEGWESWKRYWSGLDMGKREKALKGDPYYAPKGE